MILQRINKEKCSVLARNILYFLLYKEFHAKYTKKQALIPQGHPRKVSAPGVSFLEEGAIGTLPPHLSFICRNSTQNIVS